MNQTIILTRLLEKYERSKHLSQPGASPRRVMLRVEKKEFPEYSYEDASIRDTCNQAARELEQKGLVSLTWVKNRPVVAEIVLNLACVAECYHQAGRVHPKERAAHVAELISGSLATVSTPWIVTWRDAVCKAARDSMKIPSFCKDEPDILKDLLTAMKEYDQLGGRSITVRAFSTRCYQNTKHFERDVQSIFLTIARRYAPVLAAVCEQERDKMKDREQLAFLGIYARPELYELSGNCIVRTNNGEIDLSAVVPYGLALPSTEVDQITGFDMSGIDRVIFLENKTNYDEYLVSEWKPGELAVFHGGFLSPQKRKLFSILADSIPPGTEVLLWADIDLGGFQMFAQLQSLIPGLMPLWMSGSDVENYYRSGLRRGEAYLFRLRKALEEQEFPLFSDAIRKILEYGVTIEQETFLQ